MPDPISDPSSATMKAAERWFRTEGEIATPDAALLSRLKHLRATTVRRAHRRAIQLCDRVLARLQAYEQAQPVTVTNIDDATGEAREMPGWLPDEGFTQAMAVAVGGVQRLIAEHTRMTDKEKQLLGKATDDELERDLAQAMILLIEEVPMDDLEHVYKRRKETSMKFRGATAIGSPIDPSAALPAPDDAEDPE